MSLQRHSYHLVEPSPWPLITSLSVLALVLSGLAHICSPNLTAILSSVVACLISSANWVRDVSRESSSQGHHTPAVEIGLRAGVTLFITSEAIFFRAFFWRFWHTRLITTLDLGCSWPPSIILVFNPFKVPILNTTILLVRGVTITWAHFALIEGLWTDTVIGLAITIVIGVLFVIVQAAEYSEATYTIADTVYRSCFYMGTRFHGAHVIVGVLFLLITFTRLLRGSITESHHFGFEMARWYWHFVDVVWIFLFINIYWWGGQ